MAKPVPKITHPDPPTNTQEVSWKIISPPLVRESPVRVIDIVRTDANGNRSTTEVHLLGELLTD